MNRYWERADAYSSGQEGNEGRLLGMNSYGEGAKDSGHHCSDDRDEIEVEVLVLHIKECSKRLDNNNIFRKIWYFC